jgi:hypothetical protein
VNEQAEMQWSENDGETEGGSRRERNCVHGNGHSLLAWCSLVFLFVDLASFGRVSHRHLERARIIFAIEHEMGEEERGRRDNKYWTVLGGKRYLQVMVENPDHFRTRKSDLQVTAAEAEKQD